MYALCDVNSMYASCEKVFDPSIRRRPVVVLTNNDGCICSACGIAKKMGIGKRFTPYFQMKDELARIGAVIRSSNYELYADLSQKLMDTCSRFAPHSHIYSIDELFLYYGKSGAYVPEEGWLDHGVKIRKTVWKEVRLPVSIGIGATCTLAKCANYAAKKLPGFNGVAVIDNDKVRQAVLGQMKVTDVWGIGNRLDQRLNDSGIYTALQLARAKPGWIRKQFSIVVENTVHELNGQAKLNWDEVRSPKKEIYSTRSFGERITEPEQLKFALATHAGIAAVKLRKQRSLTKSLVIFANSSPHDENGYYRKSVYHHFAVPTNDSCQIMNACSQAVEEIFQTGIRFYRCGVGLLEISDETCYQQDLFDVAKDNIKLMSCMDKINARFGRDTTILAGQGIEQKFAMRREFLSPQYTTRWRDIPKIQCE
ncbi:Y-family DNA polymerase [Thalassomonas viridans]|uniref:Y-family DNA polymerase n=1 Tax=Thalassomonas viridans TaxID=137584 RepID=A0AAE9Z0S2_9GAMM|nr:Y-family DNA polymerase [Thalassomonas viridans]WDE03083.1 Y-family DNA polymerase [Thalassomonas viridans]